MDLSPIQAAQVLHELGDAEDRLSQRMGGITLMLWGIISAAIFLVYGVAESVLVGPQQIALSLLWLPFVAAGGVLTRHMWQHNAIALGRQESGTARDTVVITSAFLVLGAALFFGSRAAGITWDLDGIMCSVNGLVAAGMAVMLRHHGAAGWSHLVGAGTAMILGGLLLGILQLATGLDVLAAAAICGTSWFLAGFAIHQQG